MSIRSTLIAAAIGAAFAGLLGGGAMYHWQHAKVKVAEEAARTAQDALRRQQATVVYRDRIRVVHDRAAASQQAALAAAVASAPEWANQPVPQEVQDALAH